MKKEASNLSHNVQAGRSFYIKKLPAFQGEEHIVKLNSY